MAIDKIHNKKSISYRARVVLQNGRRKSRCFDRKVDAEMWEAKVRADGRSYGADRRRRMQFLELSLLFIEKHAKPMMTLSSYQKYEAALRKYITPEFSRLWIDEITKMQVIEFRAVIDRQELSQNTKYFVFTAFKTVLRKALEWDLIDRNPADGVKAPRKGMPRIEYWKASEVRQFLDSSRSSPHLPLFLIALNTGMRIGEILGLKWDRVDLENGMLTLSRIYCQKSNTIRETTKTHRTRQIGINPVLHSVLMGLRRQSNSEFVVEGKVYRTTAYHFSTILGRACEQANVKRLRFHDLRHTFATQFVMNGGSMHGLAGILGHTSTTMTAKYAHFGEEHAKKAAQVVSFGMPEVGNVIPFGQDKRKNLNQSGQEMVINP